METVNILSFIANLCWIILHALCTYRSVKGDTWMFISGLLNLVAITCFYAVLNMDKG